MDRFLVIGSILSIGLRILVSLFSRLAGSPVLSALEVELQLDLLVFLMKLCLQFLQLAMALILILLSLVHLTQHGVIYPVHNLTRLSGPLRTLRDLRGLLLGTGLVIVRAIIVALPCVARAAQKDGLVFIISVHQAIMESIAFIT